MSQANKAVLEKANAAIRSGDHEGFLVHCTDHIRWAIVGEEPLEGKDAVRQWMSKGYATPPTFNVARLIAEGDFLTALGVITTTDQAGKTTTYDYCDVWRFEQGKMAELQGFVIARDAE